MTQKIFSVQPILDSWIDKLFLRFIPKTVRPNQVTVVRFLLVPFVYGLLVAGQIWLGLIVFIIAASTDFIDGSMARTRNQITDLGKMLDPVADKLLILSVLLYIGFQYWIVAVFTVFIIFEIIAVLSGYFLSFAIGKPIGSNVFGKLKLILQSFSVGFFILGIIVSNQFLMDLSKYILFIALFLAVMAGIEVARQKLAYLNNHEIDLTKLKRHR